MKVRKDRTQALLRALAVLRGGAKQAAFGTDVAPKCLLLAGLTCGNPILNHVFDDRLEQGLFLRVEVLKEILRDYADRIVTTVYIGTRSGFLANEDEVKKMEGEHAFPRGKVTVKVVTPREAADGIAGEL